MHCCASIDSSERQELCGIVAMLMAQVEVECWCWFRVARGVRYLSCCPGRPPGLSPHSTANASLGTLLKRIHVTIAAQVRRRHRPRYLVMFPFQRLLEGCQPSFTRDAGADANARPVSRKCSMPQAGTSQKSTMRRRRKKRDLQCHNALGLLLPRIKKSLYRAKMENDRLLRVTERSRRNLFASRFRLVMLEMICTDAILRRDAAIVIA
ncbi:hypothetical protein BDV96DRAFT_109973 [Lophiotrema nucula]|uniref:Uncharacterized protein n=1 Tax=Lophiotrema nucula TaxID=690887 RepID=A0A6A5Z4U6_9PLEO|nr:hypothetical protein BDV96DRAFT_109973 [Lophiotrema nucula]